ncbi:TOG array regulator of axonemal microtubules protein 2 [Cucurbita pepo subsp. pepo]|uniref:TOG array regulator of axonemal microtubules protein 2 n=1 Tax=Cucurbita pepo subsp. pepo TaxID=3664 RepID=UPI000C9D7773|nr:TOG array regulator of axonemal microtubules protein 2 [Cucurbita pepo subsp. pepo]
MAMALRPIDNALPVTPERPKKQAKVAVPVQKRSDSGVNDENQAPVPPSTDAAIDYVSSENLKPLTDPDSNNFIEGFDSKDWVKVCESLNNVRRLAIFHSDILLPSLEKVIEILMKSMKNPRSALIKTSIMASSDIFNAFGDQLLETSTTNAFDQLLLQLLLKASQDKKFVCEEADKALKALVKSMTALPLLQKLKPYVSHSNLRVRAKAAIPISNCVSMMGLEEMNQYGIVPLLQMAADLLNDRLPEAREAARSIVMGVFKAFTANEEEKQEAWQSFCQTNLSPIQAQSLLKVTSSL